ncbi:MAG: MFS transporter [Acetobacteraceae bacterium]|nr:MFS transporter [Acetobacteraceae bacterium]
MRTFVDRLSRHDLRQLVIMRQIGSTVFFTFVCYATIGLPLAVLPSYVHVQLGYGEVMAGLSISAQYIATLLSRPLAGRMADMVGPKQTLLLGLVSCTVSGLCLLLAASLPDRPVAGLAAILASRLTVGLGESWVATSAIAWAIRQVGPRNMARVISWNGIATYGALAAGAPIGVALQHSFGFWSIGPTEMALAALAFPLAAMKRGSEIIPGRRLPFLDVLWRVLPHGTSLALGSIGFGTIAAFITLYYTSRGWTGAALSLTVFGLSFMAARVLFARSIGRFGGFPVAIASFTVECAGLLLLWQSWSAGAAMAGSALAGLGFSLAFPALGVEAVNPIPAHSRGTALGVYSVFLDVALGISGPLMGLIVSLLGYPSAFLAAALASVAACALAVGLCVRARPAIRPADARQD